VILPVGAVLLAHFAEVEAGVRIKPLAGEALQQFALYFQACFGRVHKAAEDGHKLFLCLGGKADAGHVDGDHTDRARERVCAKEPAAAFDEVAVVYAQAAAHTARVFRVHVRVYKVGKVRDAVFGRRLPQRV
jgi:hypothetical protein